MHHGKENNEKQNVYVYTGCICQPILCVYGEFSHVWEEGVRRCNLTKDGEEAIIRAYNGMTDEDHDTQSSLKRIVFNIPTMKLDVTTMIIPGTG